MMWNGEGNLFACKNVIIWKHWHPAFITYITIPDEGWNLFQIAHGDDHLSPHEPSRPWWVVPKGSKIIKMKCKLWPILFIKWPLCKISYLLQADLCKEKFGSMPKLKGLSWCFINLAVYQYTLIFVLVCTFCNFGWGISAKVHGLVDLIISVWNKTNHF